MSTHCRLQLLIAIRAAVLMSPRTHCAASPSSKPHATRWNAQPAWRWYRAQPWLAGFNYVPSPACNTTEWWQAETFDPKTIDRELGWAHQIGYNSARCFLQYIVWQQDPRRFKQRFEPGWNTLSPGRSGNDSPDSSWQPLTGASPAPV